MSSPLSPSELLREYIIDNWADPKGSTVVVGGATDEQQECGVIALADAGFAKAEKYAPLVWPRVQMRCVARTLERAEFIARQMYDLLHPVDNVQVIQPSSSDTWVIKQITVGAGPSMHFDSKETWEVLLFAEMVIATNPVPA